MFCTGWGQGMRRAVSEWYLTRDAMDLADCVTRYRGRHGWSHRDILKLAHIKPNDIGKYGFTQYLYFLNLC